MRVAPAMVAALQHRSFETEDELNETPPTPQLHPATSNYLTREYNNNYHLYSVQQKCDAFRVHRGSRRRKTAPRRPFSQRVSACVCYAA